MQCFQPGEVLVLPHEAVEPEEWVGAAVDEAGAEISLLHSTEDVLLHYNLERELGELRSRGVALPLVANVPEGEELRYAGRLRETRNARAVVPNFLVDPVGDSQAVIEVNRTFLDEALALVGCDDPHWGLTHSRGVKIAILDTGVNPDVLDHGCYVHPVQYNAHAPSRESEPPLSDPAGHGSLVAHIIDRIVPHAEIFSVKAIGDFGTVGGLINALLIAQTAFKPDVYNISLAITCDFEWCKSCGNPLGQNAATNTRQLEEFFKVFDEVCGTPDDRPLLVAAAGNDRGTVLMPASFENVVAVGAYDTVSQDAPPYARYVRVPQNRFFVAPGGLEDKDHALATKPGYGSRRNPMRGTSFAAPFVAGIAARYLIEADIITARTGTRLTNRIGSMWFLEQSAIRSFPSYTRSRHGSGLAHYSASP